MSRGSYGTPLVPATTAERGAEGLEPRIVTWSAYGRPQRARISPRDYNIPRFAATLADTWLEVMGELRAAESVTPPVRYFLTHVNNQLREVSDSGGDDGDGEGFTIADLRRRHLDAWEADLLKRHRQARTDTAYRDAVYVFALLRRIEIDHPGTLHRDVLERLESETRLHHVR